MHFYSSKNEYFHSLNIELCRSFILAQECGIVNLFGTIYAKMLLPFCKTAEAFSVSASSRLTLLTRHIPLRYRPVIVIRIAFILFAHLTYR